MGMRGKVSLYLIDIQNLQLESNLNTQRFGINLLLNSTKNPNTDKKSSLLPRIVLRH